MARPSSIDKLPAEVREQLHEFLRDPAVSQLEATELTNLVLDERGEKKLSKSAVNRYAMSMEKVGERLRASREMAKLWIGKLGNEPAGEVGKLLNEMIRTLSFEVMMPMVEGDEKPSAKVLNQLALAVQRLEKASSDNEKRDADIRKRVAAEAANQAVKEMVTQGMTAETITSIKNQILGIG